MVRPLVVAGFWLAAVAALALTLTVNGWWVLAAVVLAALAGLGTWDLIQRPHTILRSYPIIGHLRFLMEDIRPEIRQCFVESDTEASPFDRETRDMVYERAKATKGEEPFGTERDVTAIGYEFLRHSIRARTASDLAPRVRLGGPDCTQPYDIALLNVSGMSFGALSGNAIEALNGGAARGGFAHDTGEGGISPYHLKHGGDLIWEIGSGYFGCRDRTGRFDPAEFAAKAALPSVKAISVKLSQGAKPGLGGVLPGAKVSAEIAAARGVPIGVTVVSPPSHSAFSTPVEFLAFVATLRRLSGGKPIGFKLCVGARTEFLSICKAMLRTIYHRPGLAPPTAISGSRIGKHTPQTVVQASQPIQRRPRPTREITVTSRKSPRHRIHLAPRRAHHIPRTTQPVARAHRRPARHYRADHQTTNAHAGALPPRTAPAHPHSPA
jgi:glutamate synthase domain-containing protein 2